MNRASSVYPRRWAVLTDGAVQLFCCATFGDVTAMCVLFFWVRQGRFKESVSALQQGLAIDPNNAAQIKEKTDTEVCLKKVERAAELLKLVRVVAWLPRGQTKREGKKRKKARLAKGFSSARVFHVCVLCRPCDRHAVSYGGASWLDEIGRRKGLAEQAVNVLRDCNGGCIVPGLGRTVFCDVCTHAVLWRVQTFRASGTPSRLEVVCAHHVLIGLPEHLLIVECKKVLDGL